MFDLLLLAVALVLVLALIPSIRTWVFTKLGVTSPTLNTLLNDLETKIDSLFAHSVAAKVAAKEHKDAADQHAAQAAVHLAEADRATRVAQKIQEIVK